MKTVNIDGATVAYRQEGQGPGLLLVHGTGADGDSNWAHLVHTFKKDRTVIRPDYAGSGKTVDRDGYLSIERLAGQVIAAAEAAVSGPFDIVGHSLGASVAAVAAAMRPDLARSLVLVAGFASSNDPRLQLQFEMWEKLAENDPESMAQLMLLMGFSEKFFKKASASFIAQSIRRMTDNVDWPGMARQVRLDKRLDITHHLRKITCPTLVLAGTHDQIVPVTLVKEMTAMIPNAQYLEMDGGHLLPFELPMQFAKVVAEFIASPK